MARAKSAGLILMAILCLVILISDRDFPALVKDWGALLGLEFAIQVLITESKKC